MKMLRLTALIAIAGLYLVNNKAAVAQPESTVTYSKEALTNLTPLLRKAGQGGFKLEVGAAIFGGYMPRGRGQGNEPWLPVISLVLDPNKQYRIIAAGDNDALDLDLRVVDPATGAVIALDDRIDATAEVTFQPPRQQRYEVQFRLYDSRDHCICIGILLSR
jgi:hypothetical protein